MPGTERWMQMQRQTVRPLKLTALCAVVMLVNDCLQTVCLCVITHRYVYVYLKNTKVTVYWCKSISKGHECGCPINTENKLDMIFNGHSISIYTPQGPVG